LAVSYLSKQIPVIRKYTIEHEWISYDTDTKVIHTNLITSKKKAAQVGITNFASEALGDIVHIDLPKIGTKFKKVQSVGGIESVKIAAEIYAPLAGQVTLVNLFCYLYPGQSSTD
jgi:glycine cleavage system H protein